MVALPVAEIRTLPVLGTWREHAGSHHWHPKLTGYRLLFIVLTTAFGLSKAILTYKGREGPSIIIDWVFSVVILLANFWLGYYESNAPHSIPWLFETDYASYLWRLFAYCHCPVPSYATDEQSLAMLIKPRHPPVTGYHILFTLVVSGFGLTKAIVSYQGQASAATTLDWVLGVIVTISFYWLGLYKYSPEPFPYLFDIDYRPLFVNLKENTTDSATALIQLVYNYGLLVKKPLIQLVYNLNYGLLVRLVMKALIQLVYLPMVAWTVYFTVERWKDHLNATYPDFATTFFAWFLNIFIYPLTPITFLTIEYCLLFSS